MKADMMDGQSHRGAWKKGKQVNSYKKNQSQEKGKEKVLVLMAGEGFGFDGR